MHSCLCIAEIQQRIFEECQDGTLATLAITSKLFQEAALDALWRNQPDLKNLISCMPPDLWSRELISQGFSVINAFILKRNIKPSDWARFDYYARRIRSFGFKRYEQWNHADVRELVPDVLGVAPDVLRTMANYHGSLPFPKLHSLAWSVSEATADAAPCMRFFMGTSLRRLHLSICVIPTQVASSIAEHAVNLVDLTLCNPDQSGEWIPHASTIISGLIARLPKLRCLTDRGSLTQGAFTNVAALTDLRSLCYEPHEEREWPTVQDPPQDAFPVLQEVRLFRATLPTCTDFLGVVQSRSLQALEVLYRDWANSTEIRTHLQAVARQSTPDSLTCLTLRHVGGAFRTEIDSRRKDIDESTLTLLLPFTNLTEVVIDVGLVFAIDDSCLLAMAEAWPNIVHLELLARVKLGNDSRITFFGLNELVGLCPRLRVLGLPLDTRAPPPDPSSDTLSRNDNIKAINVSNSHLSVEQAEPVTHFLMTIFPNICKIYWYHPHGVGWAKVKTRIRKSFKLSTLRAHS